MAVTLLHGTLHATIYEVDTLKNFWKALSTIQKPAVFTTMDLDKWEVGRTRLVTEGLENPKWNESFHIFCAHSASNIIFTVKCDDLAGEILIGRACIPVKPLLNGEEMDRIIVDLMEEENVVRYGAKIHVKLQYLDVTQDPIWGRGIGSPNYHGVPYTFFPQRHGCRVSLYQDAHVPDYFMVNSILPCSNGQPYKPPHRCWEDVFDAITNAKHFIYITGWSVYTQISLIRDPIRQMEGIDVILGELLKKKASEGVKVLILVWDDRTSLMGTHDTDTKNYFKGSEVKFILCQRKPDHGGSFIENFIFTHHQKSLVVDSELSNGDSERRRVVCFVGGLDLCNGRYDTPVHSLFRTLDTDHKDDFHQPNFAGSSIKKGGPREPWHDIHTRLEGQIAWDVLYNFEQRWKKQGGKDILVNFDELNDVIIQQAADMFPHEKESWNVQLFRSIDDSSTFGFPETPEEAAKLGLVNGTHSIIDRSIHDAYIHAIRRAKNFIYIENQYFVGSSFGWKSEDVGALNLIPKELSLKIVSKINAGEKFTVYVVVPMWPEGIPESPSVQAILDWQRRTMEMMYKDIIPALQEKGLEDNPRDYLTFFCLGNREVKRGGEYKPAEAPKAGSNYEKAQQARRFMIYVHAKMMIVDDEYIIVGSANINQRSMDGARDSEIAMGGYQPYYITTQQPYYIATQPPERGQVHNFRMALWYEHLGKQCTIFMHPGSTECVREVNQIADRNWDLFSSENFETDLPSHLLRYPIGVSKEGIVIELPGTEFFPDTKARILGDKSKFIPGTITTAR